MVNQEIRWQKRGYRGYKGFSTIIGLMPSADWCLYKGYVRSQRDCNRNYIELHRDMP